MDDAGGENGGDCTSDDRADEPLNKWELIELRAKLRDPKPNSTSIQRREELLERLNTYGVEYTGKELLDTLGDMFEFGTKKLPLGPPQKAFFKVYEKALDFAEELIAKTIVESQYQQYARNRDGGAPHETALLFMDEAMKEKYRIRYEIDKVLRVKIAPYVDR